MWPAQDARRIAFGELVLDREDRSLWRGEQRVAIPPKELGLLDLLTRRAGRLVEKREILSRVWAGTHVSDAVVKVCVRNLRRILGDRASAPRFVQTDVRRGYRFVAPVAACAEVAEDPLSSSIDLVASAGGPGMGLPSVLTRSLELAQQSTRAARYRESLEHLRGALKTALLLCPREHALVHDLRVRVSEAARSAGCEAEARAVLLDALAEARAAGEGVRFARALLTLGAGHQAVLAGDRGLVDLLEEARTMLPADEEGLRACIEARLAYALARFPERAGETRALLRASRLRGRGRRTLAQEALILRYRLWASWGPGDLRLRLAGSQRLERHARGLDDVHVRLYALGLRTASALEAGDAGLYEKTRRTYLELADRTPRPWIQWNALRFRVAHATLTGRLDEAQTCIHGGVELARALHHGEALALLYGQRVILHLYQDRTPEILSILEGGLGDGTSAPAWRCVLAYAHARGGDRARARRIFEDLCGNGFGAIPRDSAWISCLTLLADACVLLRDRARARELYSRLLPHQNQHAVAYFGFSYLGPVHGALGRLARLLGRREVARRHLALADCVLERLGAYSYQRQIPELMGERDGRAPVRNR